MRERIACLNKNPQVHQKQYNSDEHLEASGRPPGQVHDIGLSDAVSSVQLIELLVRSINMRKVGKLPQKDLLSVRLIIFLNILSILQRFLASSRFGHFDLLLLFRLTLLHFIKQSFETAVAEVDEIVIFFVFQLGIVKDSPLVSDLIVTVADSRKHHVILVLNQPISLVIIKCKICATMKWNDKVVGDLLLELFKVHVHRHAERCCVEPVLVHLVWIHSFFILGSTKEIEQRFHALVDNYVTRLLKAIRARRTTAPVKLSQYNAFLFVLAFIVLDEEHLMEHFHYDYLARYVIIISGYMSFVYKLPVFLGVLIVNRPQSLQYNVRIFSLHLFPQAIWQLFLGSRVNIVALLPEQLYSAILELLLPFTSGQYRFV